MDADHSASVNISEEVASLYAFVPHWNIEILGPVFPGTFQRSLFTVSYLIADTARDAETLAWERVLGACQLWRRRYDPDEWDVVAVVPRNFN